MIEEKTDSYRSRTQLPFLDCGGPFDAKGARVQADDVVQDRFGADGLHVRHALGRQRQAPDLRGDVVDEQSSHDRAEPGVLLRHPATALEHGPAIRPAAPRQGISGNPQRRAEQLARICMVIGYAPLYGTIA
jgi:hypothetical protein